MLSTADNKLQGAMIYQLPGMHKSTPFFTRDLFQSQRKPYYFEWDLNPPPQAAQQVRQI